MISRRDFLKVSTTGSVLTFMGSTSNAKSAVSNVLPDEAFCYESERKIPLFAEVDLVVVGGSSRAVAAAVAAAKNGANVFLIGYMSYLGDDICGSFLFEREKNELPETGLARKLFPSTNLPTPLHIKSVLETELIRHGVNFLYSSYVTNTLVDDAGNLSGIVIANRSGRQAIHCKGVIDATQDATVANLFNAPFSKQVDTQQTFYYTVVGSKPKRIAEIDNVRQLDRSFQKHPVTRYQFKSKYDNTYSSLMNAEQKIRSLTWDPDQVDSSDLLWYIPNQTILSKKASITPVKSVRSLPLSAFECQSTNRLWVLGPCAEISREEASRFMRPISALTLGEVIGEQIAENIKGIPMPTHTQVLKQKVSTVNYGHVGELLKPLRPQHTQNVLSKGGALPVWGNYDVIVLGGGTAGAAAGISASKSGAKTLVLEYLHGLGGMGTLGLIGRYWDGYRKGYCTYIDKSVRNMASLSHLRQRRDWNAAWPSDWKMEWYRRELLQFGGTLWFGVLGCGALVENNKVTGIVVATPFGRGVIRSKVLIDSSGSADIAIAAGSQFEYTGKKTLAVQGAGAGPRALGDFYRNNDWIFVDDTDILDVSRSYVQAKEKFKSEFDIVKIPQTRERRRVIGEHIVSVCDVLIHRRYSDTISHHKSSFDTHGMLVDPFFILSPPIENYKTHYDADVPLRSLLPKGLEGIMTTGLGASAHRDAMPVIRMQPCLQNQGYAVGYLAAHCIKEGCSLRKVDMKKIQRHLVEIGNLPKRVLHDKDFKGFSNSEMKKAATTVSDNYKGLEVLLTDRKKCVELLHKEILTESDSDKKVALASVLCILGDARHTETLMSAVSAYKSWDKGWHYRGMGQFGMCNSKLDAFIMALGKTKDKRALPVVLEKAKLLFPNDYFSHFRAIAMATEGIGSSEAVPILSALFTMPGIRFNVIRDYNEARAKTVPFINDNSFRNQSLKELHLARALYLCGDKDELAKNILTQYASGLSGHYARYADEILKG